MPLKFTPITQILVLATPLGCHSIGTYTKQGPLRGPDWWINFCRWILPEAEQILGTFRTKLCRSVSGLRAPHILHLLKFFQFHTTNVQIMGSDLVRWRSNHRWRDRTGGMEWEEVASYVALFLSSRCVEIETDKNGCVWDYGWSLGAVSRQSSSFCSILPVTRPQSLWNLK